MGQVGIRGIDQVDPDGAAPPMTALHERAQGGRPAIVAPSGDDVRAGPFPSSPRGLGPRCAAPSRCDRWDGSKSAILVPSSSPAADLEQVAHGLVGSDNRALEIDLGNGDRS